MSDELQWRAAFEAGSVVGKQAMHGGAAHDRPMTERRFQRLLLTLPIIMPICLIPLGNYFAYNPPPHAIQVVLGILPFSMLLGWPPYAVLVLLILRWARKRPTRALWRAAPLMPLMMLLLFSVLYLAWMFNWHERRFSPGSVEELWIYWVCILAFGYFYVGIAALLKWFFMSAGGVVADRQSSPPLAEPGLGE